MSVVKLAERQEAVRLRRLGYSYSYIKKKLGVSKSSLSYWISNIELSSMQIKKMRDAGESIRVENYRKTRQKQRKEIFEAFCKFERENLLPLTARDFLVAGLFPYLGEGAKHNWWEVGISNSNPTIIKFALFWLTKILKVPKKKIRIYVHLYKNMDVEGELEYWSKTIKIPLEQFRKPYIKKSSSVEINYFTFGHGTCNVLVNSGEIKNKITAGIRVILEAAKARVDTSTPSSPRFI